eukprot:9374279-Pyramimonas_sp.AAC.1
MQLPKGASLAQFIDGSGLDSTGSAEEVAQGNKEGATQLDHALVKECGSSISLTKASQGNLLCSDCAFAGALQVFLGERARPLCDSA